MDVGLLAIAISLISLLVAVINARVTARAARISEQKASIDHVQSSVLPITVRITRVHYRWVQPSPGWRHLGGDRGLSIGQEQEITLDQARQRGLMAEVEVQGEIIGGTHDTLLTFRDHESSGRRVWHPTENQSVFTIAGRSMVNHCACLADEKLRFTWVDRRSPGEWAAIEAIRDGRNMWNDPELRLPRTRIADYPRLASRIWFYRRYGPYLAVTAARTALVHRSGFCIVGESRLERRSTVVWNAEIMASALEAYTRDQRSQKLLWKVRDDHIVSPVDDDVVRYRAALYYDLAAIIPPKHVFLQGRD